MLVITEKKKKKKCDFRTLGLHFNLLYKNKNRKKQL